MIKNRESAAQSGARKQAYRNKLENKVSHLEEENERLKKQKVFAYNEKDVNYRWTSATYILKWATYNQNPSCPQCKHLFQFLSVHRSPDGSIHDCMFEESVCLLIRATWFVPLPLEAQEESSYKQEAIYQYEDEEDDDLDDKVYFGSSSSLRIGNHRCFIPL
ncbi:uncharacterized protein LOC131235985 [Magnolia sinica]|uniref:uncharacterized protein LOC131235985 n=1 Tax=Magnolia sinica TaxID=86752 RepID=UPI0026593217|nr:uncharacterized protein LOC131235985 [Magnolia sinica]XP_058089074.1 uncharacterized protein LOC131235985 [Magnolia sinica]